MRSSEGKVIAAICVAVAMAPWSLGAQSPPAKPQPKPARQPATLAEARAALEGMWTLQSLTVHSTEGRSEPVEASGTLNSDFSSMAIDIAITPVGLKALEGLGIQSPNPVVALSGRVIIDVPKQRITYSSDDIQRKMLNFDPELAKLRTNPFAIERVRTYLFRPDGTLRLATSYDNGKEASVSVWKKAPS